MMPIIDNFEKLIKMKTIFIITNIFTFKFLIINTYQNGKFAGWKTAGFVKK